MAEQRVHTIMFHNVGRGKVSWSELLKQTPTLPIIERMVRKKGVLMSRDIECLSNEAGTAGTIYVGMRAVGTFELVTDDGSNENV